MLEMFLSPQWAIKRRHTNFPPFGNSNKLVICEHVQTRALSVFVFLCREAEVITGLLDCVLDYGIHHESG